MVHRLFYAGTVEEVMEERLQRKRDGLPEEPEDSAETAADGVGEITGGE